jgi:hypothetical protein
MPSTRRLKTAVILALFATLTILYVTQAPSNTHTSPFYTRTVAAIQARRDNEARESLMAEGKTRADRVARIQEEHDQAMVANKQKPIVESTPTASRSSEAASPVVAGAEGKPAAGRKMTPTDGTTGNKGGKVVVNPNSDDHEGVARVGNTGSSKSHESSAAKKQSQSEEEEESASDHEIEVEMNSILKKGPIIVFSKSYCPFSMKAKVRSKYHPIPMITYILTNHPTAHPPLHLHNNPAPLRRRTRPTPPRPRPASRPPEIHRPPHSAQRADQRQIDRRRRRRGGSRFRRDAGSQSQRAGRQADHGSQEGCCERGRRTEREAGSEVQGLIDDDDDDDRLIFHVFLFRNVFSSTYSWGGTLFLVVVLFLSVCLSVCLSGFGLFVLLLLSGSGSGGKGQSPFLPFSCKRHGVPGKCLECPEISIEKMAVSVLSSES